MRHFTVRSGSTRADGVGALFATPRAVSGGDLDHSALRPGALPARSADAEIVLGDVLVVLKGPVNAAAAIEELPDTPLFATLDIAVLRPAETLHPGYLAWYINLPSTQAELVEGRLVGAVAKLPLPALAALNLPVPPLDMQRRAAEIAMLGRHERRLTQQLSNLRQQYVETALKTVVETAAQ